MSETAVPRQTRIVIEHDGLAAYHPGFLDEDEAGHYFDVLHREVAWGTESITIYGRQVQVPRRMAWYGDPGAVYTYSGVRHEPLPWIAPLLELKSRIESHTGHRFNSVLANLYRNGADSMGWHADAEAELGKNPVIASVSLGAARNFKFQHKKTKQQIGVVLEPGSLLLMEGELQRRWRHSLPKTQKPVGPRINLTFRYVLPPSG